MFGPGPLCMGVANIYTTLFSFHAGLDHRAYKGVGVGVCRCVSVGGWGCACGPSV